MRTLDDLIRDTEPFPAGVVEKLPPRGDPYVPWYQYAQRLLLHYPNHTYRVTAVHWAGGVWAVTVELTLGDVTFGAVGEDDSPTAAESNAYKRAAAHAGIGLHLYDEAGYWLHNRLVKEKDPADG
jgi:hypothetical protein